MAVILFKEFDLLANVFETGQGLNKRYMISFCDLASHFSGYDGRDNCTVLRKDTKLFSLGKKVLQDQHA